MKNPYPPFRNHCAQEVLLRKISRGFEKLSQSIARYQFWGTIFGAIARVCCGSVSSCCVRRRLGQTAGMFNDCTENSAELGILRKRLTENIANPRILKDDYTENAAEPGTF